MRLLAAQGWMQRTNLIGVAIMVVGIVVGVWLYKRVKKESHRRHVQIAGMLLVALGAILAIYL